MEDKRLTEKISASAASDDALIHIVEPGNVSQHPTGSSFKAKAKNVVNSFQNNKGVYKFLTFYGVGQLTNEELVSKINFMGQFGNFTILPDETPVIVSGLKTDGSSLFRHTYIFTGGKGVWGSGPGQTPVTEDQLIKISTFPATIQDIPNDSNTQTIVLGELPDGDYIAAANAEEHDFSDENIVYFFSYIQEGVEYRVMFNGTPGVYGGEGNPQFTTSNLIPSTNSNVEETPIPNIQQVATVGNVLDNKPLFFKLLDKILKITHQGFEWASGIKLRKVVFADPADGHPDTVTLTIPSRPSNDVFAFLGDVNGLTLSLDQATDNIQLKNALGAVLATINIGYISSEVSDASTTVKGVVKLAEDLGGTAEAPRVVKLNGLSDEEATEKVAVTVQPDGTIESEPLFESEFYDEITGTGYANLAAIVAQYPSLVGGELKRPQGFKVYCYFMTNPTIYVKCADNDLYWLKIDNTGTQKLL